MTDVSWWNTVPFWAQAFLIIGAVVFYMIMGYITYKIIYKISDYDEDNEQLFFLSAIWPLSLPVTFIFLLLKLIYLPFKIDEDIERIKHDVCEINNKLESKSKDGRKK